MEPGFCDDSFRLQFISIVFYNNSIAGSLVCFSERISKRNKLRAYIQTMEGLTFIHSNDIIHCDIKPDNILITHSGNFLITDFGEAVDLKVQKIYRSQLA